MSVFRLLIAFAILSVASVPAVADDFFAGVPAAEKAFADYKASPDCDGKELSDALEIVSIRRRAIEGLRVAAEMTGGDTAEPGLTVARAENSLATAALEKKCFDVARQLYLGVIDTYTGEAFASARERAKIGIDDVRSAQDE